MPKELRISARKPSIADQIVYLERNKETLMRMATVNQSLMTDIGIITAIIENLQALPCKTCAKDREWWTAEVSTEAAIYQAEFLLDDWKDNIKHFAFVKKGFINSIRAGHKLYLKHVAKV